MLPALGRRIGGGSIVRLQESLPGSTTSGIETALGFVAVVVSSAEIAATAAGCLSCTGCCASGWADLVGIGAVVVAPLGREALAESRNRR